MNLNFEGNKNNTYFFKELSLFLSTTNINYLSALTIGIFMFGHNDFFSLLGTVILTLLLFFNLESDFFFYSYYALFFFESIVVSSYLGGNFFRVYYVLFLIRLVVDIFFRKKKLAKFSLILIAGFLFLFLSTLYVVDIKSLISFSINILILIYISAYFNATDKKNFLNHLLLILTVYSVLSGIYSLLFLPQLIYGGTFRFIATAGDPNYAAVYFTVGLFSAFGTNLLHKKIKFLFIFLNLFFLMLTVSLTGLFVTILLVVFYLGFTKLRYAIFLTSTLMVSLITFLKLNINYGETLNLLKTRILFIFSGIDINTITSNRSSIVENYISHFIDLPLKKQLFGGNNTISGPFRNYMVDLYGFVSHFTYIDMLFMIGIVGTALVILIFIYMIYQNIKTYIKNRETIYLSVAFIKISILFYGLSISIFPYRYFYLFFLI